jgi:hypothetical protein
MILRVFANQHCQADIVEVAQQRLMPEFGALLTWRQIAGIARSGITKPHRNKSHQAGVVKMRAFNSQPTVG